MGHDAVPTIGMTQSEVIAFFNDTPIGAFGSVTTAGRLRVEPSVFSYDGSHLYMTLNRDPVAGKMSAAETTNFLDGFRNPGDGTPLFLAAATLRQDGTSYV